MEPARIGSYIMTSSADVITHDVNERHRCGFRDGQQPVAAVYCQRSSQVQCGALPHASQHDSSTIQQPCIEGTMQQQQTSAAAAGLQHPSYTHHHHHHRFEFELED